MVAFQQGSSDNLNIGASKKPAAFADVALSNVIPVSDDGLLELPFRINMTLFYPMTDTTADTFTCEQVLQ